jgi:NADPH:quinone reductase
MRAVVITSDESASPELTELQVPEPAAGEVRVKVAAAAVNGFDLAVASGGLKAMMEHRYPLVLGKDFAGTVDALGEGVEGYQIGDRVFGVVTKDFLGDGSFADYVTVPTTVGLTHLPEDVDFTAGAALGLAGTAAVDAVDAAGLEPGVTVLISGATGGVGQQALQLAVHAGAQAIATIGSDQDQDLVTGLGAAATVDYTIGDVAEQVLAAHPGGVDVVFHFAGEPAGLVSAVKPGGRLVSTLIMNADALPTEDIEVVGIYATPSAATLQRLATHQAQGHTSVTIQQVYDLAQAGQAFEDFAAGTQGKLVLTIGQ